MAPTYAVPSSGLVPTSQEGKALMYVDASTTALSPTGSQANPFPTIQQAIDALEANAVAGLIVTGSVLVAPGLYPEDLNIPSKLGVLQIVGSVNKTDAYTRTAVLGSSYAYPPPTTNNITIHNNSASQPAITTQRVYLVGLYVSGTIYAKSDGGYRSLLIGVESCILANGIYDDPVSPISAVGAPSFTGKDSWILHSTGNAIQLSNGVDKGLVINQIYNIAFSKPINIRSLQFAHGCLFSGVTVIYAISSVGVVRGFHSCRFAGGTSFTGPADSFQCDESTYYMSFVKNSGGAFTLAGGASIALHSSKNKKSTDTASATDITLPTDGDFLVITGNNTINTVSAPLAGSGTRITLAFSGTPTVKHLTAGTGAQIKLSGSTDLVVAAADTLLNLVYDGSFWQEESRKIP